MQGALDTANNIAVTVQDAANATGSISRTSSAGSDITVRASNLALDGAEQAVSRVRPVLTIDTSVFAPGRDPQGLQTTDAAFTPGNLGFGFRPYSSLPLPHTFLNPFS